MQGFVVRDLDVVVLPVEIKGSAEAGHRGLVGYFGDGDIHRGGVGVFETVVELIGE